MQYTTLAEGNATMLTSKNRYTARLYYHGRLEQEFYGNLLNRLLAELHLYVGGLSSGATGTIMDERHQKIVHSCTYNSAQ